MKCPSCGFDSPEGASWCDFCKHPFRKEKPPETRAAAPAPPPAGAIKEIIAGLPPEVAAKVPPHIHAAASDIEKVPTISKEVRLLAWVFLGFWFVMAMILGGILWGRKRALAEAAREDAEAARQQDASGIERTISR